MGETEFNRLYIGDFQSDSHLDELVERLKSYYLESEHLGNREVLPLWKKFRDWARYAGYSSKEINKAKQIANANN
jgi:hypothetical protein